MIWVDAQEPPHYALMSYVRGEIADLIVAQIGRE